MFCINEELQYLQLPNRLEKIVREEKISDYTDLEETLNDYTSYYLLPNHFVSFYYVMKLRSAKKERTCDISGSRIYKGSNYIIYHPFLEDLCDGKIYTIKKDIYCEIGYATDLPRNIKEYEYWYNCLVNNIVDKMDFNTLANVKGQYCLELKPIGKGRR